jgi:nitrite reductase/ring-hydroxylating ferredoxin subunit
MSRVSIPAASVPSPGARSQVRIGDKNILVFNVHGVLYAIDDTCPHAGASLANGKIDGLTLQCRAHGLRFDLRTGCMSGGRGLSIGSYAIEVNDGQAFLTLPDSDTAVLS